MNSRLFCISKWIRTSCVALETLSARVRLSHSSILTEVTKSYLVNKNHKFFAWFTASILLQILRPYFRSRTIHSIFLSSMAVQSFVGPWPLLQFRNLFYTDRRIHWTSDQLVSRPLPTHRTTEAQNKRTQICLEWDLNPRSQRSSERRRLGHCDRRSRTYTILIILQKNSLFWDITPLSLLTFSRNTWPATSGLKSKPSKQPAWSKEKAKGLWFANNEINNKKTQKTTQRCYDNLIKKSWRAKTQN
jgi:hypothetical protein